jgi:hypothetical protein
LDRGRAPRVVIFGIGPKNGLAINGTSPGMITVSHAAIPSSRNPLKRAHDEDHDCGNEQRAGDRVRPPARA